VIAGETIAISQKLGGEPGEQKVPAGTVAFFPYADMTDGYVHRVSVSGTKPFINIGVDFQEIAPSAERRALVPTWSSKFAKLIAENRRGRAYRIELDPGQALVIPDNGSALLVVALSTATIIFSNATTDASPWESNMGDFKFFESARPQQLSNASANGASLIVFQAY